MRRIKDPRMEAGRLIRVGECGLDWGGAVRRRESGQARRMYLRDSAGLGMNSMLEE